MIEACAVRPTVSADTVLAMSAASAIAARMIRMVDTPRMRAAHKGGHATLFAGPLSSRRSTSVRGQTEQARTGVNAT